MGTDGQRIRSKTDLLASAAKMHAKNIETVHGHTGLSLPNTKALFMRANALRKDLIVIHERN